MAVQLNLTKPRQQCLGEPYTQQTGDKVNFAVTKSNIDEFII